MELFETEDHFILQSGYNALWCSRKDGSFTAKRGICQYVAFSALKLFSS